MLVDVLLCEIQLILQVNLMESLFLSLLKQLAILLRKNLQLVLDLLPVEARQFLHIEEAATISGVHIVCGIVALVSLREKILDAFLSLGGVLFVVS